MRARFDLRRLGLALLLGVFVSLVAGCATDDPENISSRPWSAPKSWEHGLPPEMFQGR
jgi:hypothetical protein